MAETCELCWETDFWSSVERYSELGIEIECPMCLAKEKDALILALYSDLNWKIWHKNVEHHSKLTELQQEQLKQIVKNNKENNDA